MESLSSAIRDGYSIGDRLPTQEQIAKENDVSLITVKRAIAELSAQGVVESIRGKGTIVRALQPTMFEDHREGISSWTENLRAAGDTPGTAWTQIKRIAPSRRSRDTLGVKAREKIIVIERLRTLAARPLCLMRNELPERLFPGFPEYSLPAESLYSLLKDRYDVTPQSAQETVTARIANDEEKDIFVMDDPVLLVITRHTFSQDGDMFEISEVTVPTDRYRYTVNLSPKQSRAIRADDTFTPASTPSTKDDETTRRTV